MNNETMNKVNVVADGALGDEIKLLMEKSGYAIQSDLSGVDVIVEAIIADKDQKRSTLIHAAASAPKALILTSTLNASATEVASWIDQPNRVVGWAALPPLEKSKVIEVANPKGLQDPSGLDRAKVFFESLSREAITVNDTVGGVLPRVVANLINGAVFAVMEGVASPRDIDQAMKLGTNYPHGPLEWGDRIGLDQVLGIMNALYEAHGERYRPAPLLVQMVQAKKKFYK
ncbi:MAG: 3-hydroxyacyl-CoA dehydrogenase family protein [Chloroflexota bacterium]